MGTPLTGREGDVGDGDRFVTSCEGAYNVLVGSTGSGVDDLTRQRLSIDVTHR